MSALVRCPKCDTFVKPASIDSSSCPFCPSSNARNIRNPIPGMVLAATLGVAPAACSRSATPEPDPVPVYGIAVEETDTGKEDVPVADAGVPVPEVPEPPTPVYGGPPDMDRPEPRPDQDKPVYGIAQISKGSRSVTKPHGTEKLQQAAIG